jgi:hypothetical protein
VEYRQRSRQRQPVIGNAMPPSEQVERIDVDAPAHAARFG